MRQISWLLLLESNPSGSTQPQAGQSARRGAILVDYWGQFFKWSLRVLTIHQRRMWLSFNLLEIELVKKAQTESEISPSNPCLAKLSPILASIHPDGLVQVNSRLSSLKELPEQTCIPIILPRKSVWTEAIIRHMHSVVLRHGRCQSYPCRLERT